MASSTVVSCGSQVATMQRPTDSGVTPRSRSACTRRVRGRVGERLLFARGRRVQKRAVLGHDPVEQIEPRHHALQVVQLAAGDEHQAAP